MPWEMPRGHPLVMIVMIKLTTMRMMMADTLGFSARDDVSNTNAWCLIVFSLSPVLDCNVFIVV